MTNYLKRITTWRRWSPLLLLIAIVALASFGWYGPFSISYLMCAVIIGADFSILTIAFWRWQLKFPGSLLWMALSVVLIAGGFYWSRDQTFGVNPVGGYPWSLAGQFTSTVAIIFFGVLTAARGRLDKSPDVQLG